MTATNHLHLSVQNPLKRSISTHVLKVPHNAQATWSNGKFEEPRPERLPGRRDRGCLVRSGASSHHYNFMPNSHVYSQRRNNPMALLAKCPFLLGYVSTPPRPMGKYGGDLFLVPSEPRSETPSLK
jgi:hypothetical protein